jgi:3-phytase
MLSRALLLALCAGVTACATTEPLARPVDGSAQPPLAPARVTAQVPDDPDDPAIWVHPTDRARSLIITTNKVAAPKGGLFVFGLDGTIRQSILGIDRPNNVDVEYGVELGGRTIDIAVTTERYQHRLRVFAIAPDGSGLAEIGAVPVLAGETGERSEPMGIGLYRRPRDRALFAIVGPKSGGADDYLWQYRLSSDSRGGITGSLVRRFGAFSQKGPAPGEPGEVEAIAVDDELGYVYYADERDSIHKWHADPDHRDAARELAAFGRSGYQLDREGLAIYTRPDGTGFIVSTDQIPNGSVFHLFRREGAPDAPHDHSEVVATVRTTADDTDGIEVSSVDLPDFRGGLLVAMNSRPKNFALFRWSDIEARRK